MDSLLLSLSKLFTERIFRIPDYQRGYAWTEKHVKDYWNDLTQLQDNKNHYVGVLTLENVPQNIYNKWEDDLWIIESKSFAPSYIVDGQQRLTTSIILIQAIIESIGDKKVNYTSSQDIKKRFIYDSKDEGISRSFIFGYEKDNPSYEYLKTKIFNEPSQNNFIMQETTYTSNLSKAKDFFLKQLGQLSFHEIENIYKKLTQNFLFNIYTISSDIDVFITFETMNNRGKPLSHLELLKNRLIYLSTLFSTPDFEKEALRKNINECWKDIYHYLGKNKQNQLFDDDFLLCHFMLYFSKESPQQFQNYYFVGLRRRLLYEDDYFKKYLLEEKFITKNLDVLSKDTSKITIAYINEYVKNLKISIKHWYTIFNPMDSEHDPNIKEYLLKIDRIGGMNFTPLIMVFLKEDISPKTLLEFLKVTERYLFLDLFYVGCDRLLADENINALRLAEKLFLKESTPDDVIRKLNDYVNKLLYNKELNEEVYEKFSKNGFYSWRAIYYFLFEYEQDLKLRSKNERDKIDWLEYAKRDYESIEHIYPQKPKHDYWLRNFHDYNQKERYILKNTLGNLVPLAKAKNSSLKNKPFPEKIGNDLSPIGYMYGSYSEIELTNYDDWNANSILDRGIKLLVFLEKRWGIRIGSGSKKDKKSFLGLDFIKDK